MASLTDIVTVAQSIVTALNNAAQTYLQVNGTTSAKGIAAATLVKSGAGRLATVDVLVAGAVGSIYDANSAASTSNKLHVIPATVGVTFVNLPFAYGLVVAPGAAQVVTIGYS